MEEVLKRQLKYIKETKVHKDPMGYNWITYLWVMILSLWGGTANTIRRIKEGYTAHFSISEWLGDAVIAGFLGLLTFYLCEYANTTKPLNAVLVGIAAHQGTRGLVLLEKLIYKKLKKEIDT